MAAVETVAVAYCRDSSLVPELDVVGREGEGVEGLPLAGLPLVVVAFEAEAGHHLLAEVVVAPVVAGPAAPQRLPLAG